MSHPVDRIDEPFDVAEHQRSSRCGILSLTRARLNVIRSSPTP